MRRPWFYTTFSILLLNAFFEIAVLLPWPSWHLKVVADSGDVAFSILSVIAATAMLARWRGVLVAAFLAFVARWTREIEIQPWLQFGGEAENGYRTVIAFRMGDWSFARPDLSTLVALLLGLTLWAEFGTFVDDLVRRVRDRVAVLARQRPATLGAVVVLMIEGWTGTGLEESLRQTPWMRLATFALCAALCVLLAWGLVRGSTAALFGTMLLFGAEVIAEGVLTFGGDDGTVVPLVAAIGLIDTYKAFDERPSRLQRASFLHVRNER